MLNGSPSLLFSMTDGITLGSARAIRWAAVLFVTVLTAAAAQVSVPLPFTPVPLTLQPMVVLLGGAALGSRLGFSSQVLYLLAGLAGLPVFAASPVLPQGALRLLGPTGGFLLAYPLAAFVAGGWPSAVSTAAISRRWRRWPPASRSSSRAASRG